MQERACAAMKKFIRYLYEYQNGRRVRNVGFVKAEESGNSAVIQIYGKGFPAAGNQTLEILLFYLMGDQVVGISMGMVKGNQQMFGYRLEFAADDVGGEDIFRNIEGIILLSDNKGFRRWYGAVWNERPVNIEQMMRREEILRREENPEEETEEERQEPESIELEETVTEEPVEEESVEEETAAEETVTEEAAAEEAPSSHDTIYKITRQDMAKLPRRDWKLANNQFLLHGYHNYHHLVSFEKDGKCWLGVPGIYHPGELRAAQAFGFEQFMKPDEDEIDLTEEECNDEDEFGYWCRTVGAVIAD